MGKLHKLHISDFIAKVSNAELLRAVEDQLHWQKTSKRKFDRTVKDDLVELYYEPLIGHYGVQTQFAAYNFITNEISIRLYNETITNGNPFANSIS